VGLDNAEPSVKDYDERRAPLLDFWKAQNGRQSGDIAELKRRSRRTGISRHRSISTR